MVLLNNHNKIKIVKIFFLYIVVLIVKKMYTVNAQISQVYGTVCQKHSQLLYQTHIRRF